MKHGTATAQEGLMERTLAPIGIVLLVTVALGVGCTRKEDKPAAKATASPVVKAVATPASPQAVAATPAAAAELYVDLEADPDEGAPPLTVKFTSSTEDATPPLTYKWDFGDGSPPSSDANPTHVYQKAGDYTATLTVKDSKGQTGSEEIDILVETD
jgi:PKD repeat protein